MNLRQAVTFAILMGADMRDMAPVYVLEKAQSCAAMAVPEVLLDRDNQVLFRRWAADWRNHGAGDWDTERDLNRPMSEVLEEETR